jgi:cytidylate kinase
MDGMPTRREMQKAFNKLGNNDSELMLMVDNLNLVVNLLCEKAGVTKGEIEVYVAKKAAEMKAFVEAQEKAAAEAANEQSY